MCLQGFRLTHSMGSAGSPARIRSEAEAEAARIRATATTLNEIAAKKLKDALVQVDIIKQEAIGIKNAAYVEAARIIAEVNARVRDQPPAAIPSKQTKTRFDCKQSFLV